VAPTAAEPGFPGGPTYRSLAWSDVQALAAADGVELHREDRGLRIVFPWLRAAAG
jgi:hypothetical protein